MKKWKIALSLFVVFVPGVILIGRLFFLQITSHDMYKAWATGQQNVYNSEQGERGKIFFKGGEILATNVMGQSLIIKNKDIKDKNELVAKLTPILKISEEDLLNRLDGEEVNIKVALTDDEKIKIQALGLTGVSIVDGSNLVRKYPQNETAAQVLGFVGGENEGQYGVEGYYNDILRGKEIYIKKGFNIGELLNGNEESSSGSDIYLTLDYNIQTKAEELLKKAKDGLKFQSGQIIVLEPKTGKLLALANYPGFNPNNYSSVKDYSLFQNVAIQKLFEPGSIFKPITMVSAIDKDKVTPTTKYVDTGIVVVGQSKLYNYDKRSYGERTMTEVLEKSINTGAVYAERQLGNKNFSEYVEKFGFFEPTGIDLQGEVSSENKEFKKGYEVNFCTAAFGQGIEVTPMQMVRAFTALTNGGKMVKPHIVEKIVTGAETEEIKPEFTEPIVSEKAATEVSKMMVSVLENGFSKKARIPGYYVSGKTGTAQVSYSALNISKKGYSDQTWQSFVGFGPETSPRFLVMVKLDGPQASTAEYSAMPVYKELGQFLIDYLKIPPDYEVQKVEQ